jgi:Zn-dependent protease
MKKVLLAVGVLVLVVGLILIIGGVTFLGEEVVKYHGIFHAEETHTEANTLATVAGIVVLVIGGYLIFTSKGTPPKKLKGGT